MMNPEKEKQRPSKSTGGVISEVETVQLIKEAKCATWSENPEKPEWEVSLNLNATTEKPEDLSHLIGFAVISNLAKHSANRVKNRKVHSKHDKMNLSSFSDLLISGSNFTKLELEGDFFNNVFLCKKEIIPNTTIDLILLPNLKTLSIKAKLALTLKGLDENTQHKYYSLHRAYCNTIKTRAAKNLWYIFTAFKCPMLNTLEIMDRMEWDDPELKNNGFYYWDQPLISFLQRHAKTLQSFKTSPIIAMQLNKSARSFKSNDCVPCLDDLLFWMKLHLDDFSSIPVEQRELKFQIEIEKLLRPWRQFLQAQTSLKNLMWITDAQNPWAFTRRDFDSLARRNSGIESLMVAVHGEQQLREAHDFPELPMNPMKDYQIDAAILHAMTSLRILSLGCYGEDPQMKNFCFFNLHLLPPTLNSVQLFGIRVMGRDLESLSKLPALQSLSLVQGESAVYTEQDELNGNIEGVTENVLRMLLTSTRGLDKLVIVGFPISKTKCEMTTKSSAKNVEQSSKSSGWFGGICGAMCIPNLVDHEAAKGKCNSNRKKLQQEVESLCQYSEQLQELITTVALFGEVCDVSDDDKDQLMTMLKIGDI